jgi:hypothetical protein
MFLLLDLSLLPPFSCALTLPALAPSSRSLPCHVLNSCAGMFLLLDLSLLLTADMGELHALLLQLHGLRRLMPTDDPAAAKPLVEAYCTEKDLIKVRKSEG